MHFEEIYKIKTNDDRLDRNILGVTNSNSKSSDFSGLNTFIWNRRNRLNGVHFSGITEIIYPAITSLEMINSKIGNHLVKPKGYIADIMEHLMLTLNFTISTYVKETRYNWTYMVKMVNEGNYDVGYTWFTFDLKRSILS